MKLPGYKRTKISIGILLLMLIASISYSFLGPDDYRSMLQQLFDKNGKILEKPPYPPSNDYWLGTDRNGRDNLLLIIDGIKYTFAAVLAVSLVRVLLGGILGVITELWVPFLKPFFKAFFLPFQYVPVLMIAVYLMDPVFFSYNEIPIMVKLEYQLIVLFLLGFPSVFFYTADYIKEIKIKSYVTSSFLLGGSKFHILSKQILPHLKPKLVLVFVQQVLQTLQIILGLAMFSLFIGGQHKELIYLSDQKKSILPELSALTGQNFWWFKYAPWVASSSLMMLLVIFLLVIVIKNELIANMEGEKNIVFSASKTKQKNPQVHEQEKKDSRKFDRIIQKVLDQ